MDKVTRSAAFLRDFVALVIVLGITFSLLGAVAYVGSGLAFQEAEEAPPVIESH